MDAMEGARMATCSCVADSLRVACSDRPLEHRLHRHASTCAQCPFGTGSSQLCHSARRAGFGAPTACAPCLADLRSAAHACRSNGDRGTRVVGVRFLIPFGALGCWHGILLCLAWTWRVHVHVWLPLRPTSALPLDAVAPPAIVRTARTGPEPPSRRRADHSRSD